MEKFSELLRQKKLKKTPLRVAILEIFFAQTEPITIVQLEKILAEQNFLQNNTSLYRQMESLTASKIIQSVMLKNSVAHFELQKSHHYHFMCEKCQKIACIEDEDLENEIHKMKKKLSMQGFLVYSHQFSVYGKCQTCM